MPSSFRSIGKKGAALIGCAFAAAAFEEMKPHSTAFTHAMHLSMKAMNEGMSSAKMTGDVDYDFAAMMIPHHEGAIAMAKAELMYGKNQVMRRLAQEILVDQQSEIDVMRSWIDKRQAKEK